MTNLLAILIYLTLSPTLLSPADGSTVASSALTWQTPSYELYTGNPYRVQVDNDVSLSSPNKDYYTARTSYTPSLTDGLWYWRIKAKDSSGTWSDWSNIWSFTLSSTSPSPSPSSSHDPSPTPSSSTSSFFSISNVPAQIDSTQNFSVAVTLSIPSPNSTFYLKGAFKKKGSSNYFGLTKVGTSWIKNGEKYSEQYSITADGQGNWSGNLEIQPDATDSGFDGSGDYLFKVARYTSSGSGPTWTSETNIKINAKEIEKEKEEGEEVVNLSKLSPQKSPAVLGKSKNVTDLPKLISSTPSAKLTSSPSSALVKSAQKKNFNLFFLAGGIFLFASGGLSVYLFLKSRVKSLS